MYVDFDIVTSHIAASFSQQRESSNTWKQTDSGDLIIFLHS